VRHVFSVDPLSQAQCDALALFSGQAPIPESLPGVLIERLKSHGVGTVEQWRQLGRKRLKLFGLTRRHVALIDAAVMQAIRRERP
jgi:hypothetical protein